jgi:hypothetical protein
MFVTVRTYEVSLDGGILHRGFWLYVWEVITPEGNKLLYVGRTGDSSSPNAQSPFNRMGQHLGFAKTSCMLRNHLDKRKIVPELCSFRLLAYGPILDEADEGVPVGEPGLMRGLVGVGCSLSLRTRWA